MTGHISNRALACLRCLAFASVFPVLACSSSDPASPAQAGAPNASAGAANQAGAANNGGAAPQAGASNGGASAGSPSAAGASNGGGPSAGASAGGASNGGAPAAAGAGGTGSGASGAAGSSGGSAGGGSGVASYSCNLVIGIDSTGEWFTSGFENQVPNDRWEIIYHHPAYIEDWAKSSDDVYGLTPTSPCTMNADNPDRVIFNMFADTADTAINNKAAWVTALTSAVTNLKAKYSRLKRIDLLTMTRAPNNTACDSSNASGSSVAQYTDDAVTMMVSAGPPAIVASPKFFATDCNVFTSGGPHFTDAGKPIIAMLYGAYYSAEQ